MSKNKENSLKIELLKNIDLDEEELDVHGYGCWTDCTYYDPRWGMRNGYYNGVYCVTPNPYKSKWY